MSDDSDDDSYCRYGTPLDPYEEDQVPKKKSAYQDISEQYALDANGKRRFHGAFTGGFTAGHGNTVGAPEGWAPAAFKSSRSQRADKSQFQKPEDFMDDEDRSEFGIAPRLVQPTTEFGGGKRKQRTQFHDGPIPGEPVLQVLLEPVHDTAAMKILRSMGWRPGKGVGEKVTRGEKKKTKKVYSCHIPKEFRQEITTEAEEPQEDIPEESESSEDEEFSDLLFEPDDFEPYVAQPKTNNFGLGYSGLSRHSVLGGSRDTETGQGQWRGSHLVTSDKGRKVSIRGQAFGVGAMEEEDEDIYAKEDLSNYDYTLESERKSKEKKPNSKSLQASSYRTVLEGFVPASSKVCAVKVYPPPALPRDFVPGVKKPSRFSPIGEGTSGNAPEIRNRSLGRHDLTAKNRGALLGENATPVLEENVLNEPDISTENKNSETPLPQSFEDRVAAIIGRNVNFVSDSSSAEASNTEDKKAEAFKPFASNPEKQTRYEKYVEMRSSGQDVTSESLHHDKEKNRLTEWERVRELSEFERSFKLYKPLTGLMNDRFVSATRADEDIATVQKFERDSSQYAGVEKLEAARVGMFGKLTREVTRWVPDTMVCRRFNIADPYDEGSSQQGKDRKKTTYSIFEYLETPIHNKNSFLNEQSGKVTKAASTTHSNELTTNDKPTAEDIETETPSTSKDNSNVPVPQNVLVKTKRMTVAELFLQEKEKERENLLNQKTQLEFQKDIASKDTETSEVKETIDNFNKIDLYKAVFLSDSESEDGIEESTKPKQNDQTEAVSKEVHVFNSPPRNVQRNTSPPKGIFANLNFERLNSWQNSSTRNDDDIIGLSKETEIKKVDSVKKEEIVEKEAIDPNIYGPKLPEKHVFRPKTSKSLDEEQNATTADKISLVDMETSSDSSDGWVEAGKAKVKKSKSKHKKVKKSSKKKHKEHKHKSKRKHKNRKSED